MLKRKTSVFLLIFLLILNFSLNVFAGEIEEKTDYIWLKEEIIDVSNNNVLKPDISSKYAIVLDRDSKAILWKKNENIKVPMASTTKIMTAIILLENIQEKNISLNTSIEICKEAANIRGSRLGLKTADKITINDLLYGLMLCSGNDCAIQIAVTISGNVESFAKLMNDKLEELNLKNTHFVTPHGLDTEGHYTTAYELALITDYALKIEKFSDVVSTRTYNVLINGYTKTISNTNELLGYLNGVDGVKTGFTNEAGRCLVTSVNRNNFNIIIVVLGANTKKIRTKDSINLIEYVYKNYERVDLKKIIEDEFESWKRINEKRISINKGKKENISIKLKENEYKVYPIKKNELNDINILIQTYEYMESPIYKEDVIGSLKVNLNNIQIGNIDIIASEDIMKKNVLDYLVQIFRIYNCNKIFNDFICRCWKF